MAELCAEAGCDRKKYAKQLCSMHYKRTRARTPDKPQTVACIVCGAVVIRTPRKRALGATCSYNCRRILTFGERCQIPADHPARWFGTVCSWTPPSLALTRPAFQSGKCADCDSIIVEPTGQTPSRWCSERCSRRAGRRQRRAREANAVGSFRHAQVIRQYQRQGSVCAYCRTPCIGLPDPEHVIPLSRGGDNAMSNIVAACRPCNADKRDLTPPEWATDRARRGLDPVDTSLTGPAYAHLTATTPLTLAA
ncbi:HNH endonuclease [Microbacterium enclense]|uniref:HNH endonuclease n=1 Tax=Microbacterium enclense TaxID=993073 RepID=UPI00342DB82E